DAPVGVIDARNLMAAAAAECLELARPTRGVAAGHRGTRAATPATAAREHQQRADRECERDAPHQRPVHGSSVSRGTTPRTMVTRNRALTPLPVMAIKRMKDGAASSPPRRFVEGRATT